MLRTAAANYTSTVEYPQPRTYYPVSEHLKGVTAVMAVELGTRVYYTMHGSFDTHGDELVNHTRLWDRLSISLDAFFADLDQHAARQDTIVLLFSEFGRRIKDNNGGTDHGDGGVAMLIGDSVRGGLYGDYPSLAPSDQDEGDVRAPTGFRALYASILEQFLDVDPRSRGAQRRLLPAAAAAARMSTAPVVAALTTARRVVDPRSGTFDLWELPTEEDFLLELLRHVFGTWWPVLRFGTFVPGAVWEIRPPNAPVDVRLRNGTATVDFGAWHFHLCIGPYAVDPALAILGGQLIQGSARSSAELGRRLDGEGAPVSWFLRLTAAAGNQQLTVWFLSPLHDDEQRLEHPD